ncbi:MAG: SDR family oxidoreductase [Gordonia sp. (in: high G+C Gram-positive bacteria)]|uniref:SDR family oxidoreductase n=1 Tax=Gordonia sp. (in: high G+C Gram-positive bacteria) TaxID=84139 RepID=UPI0039E71557
MMRVVIVGGHGKVALRAARLLCADGHEVTALIRNPAHAAEVRETGATPVIFDVEAAKESAFADVFVGHDAIVWSAGAGGGNPARTYAVDRDAAKRSMDAASAAGVRRYVMVSYFGAALDHGVPEGDSFFAYAEAKAAADEYLRSTALDWTILGPSRLTDEPATGIAVSEPGAPSPGLAKGMVSRDAVAQVIVAALGDRSTIGRQLEFNDGDGVVGSAW